MRPSPARSIYRSVWTPIGFYRDRHVHQGSRGRAPAHPTSDDGAALLQTALSRCFRGPVEVLQTDGGPECKGAVAQQARAYCDRHRIARPYKKNEQAYIESFNRR